ncbi:MAG: STN domain-containing protein [Planctomycetota bacterium]
MIWRPAGLFLFIFVSLAAAESEPVGVRWKQRRLDEALHDFGKTHNIQIEVDKKAGAERLTLALDGVASDDVIRCAAFRVGARAKKTKEGWRIAAPRPDAAWTKAQATKLDTKRFSGSALNMRSEEVFPYLANLADVNIVVDPGGAGFQKEHVKLEGTEQASVCSLVIRAARATGLTWDFRWGVVFLATPKRMGVLPRTSPASFVFGLGADPVVTPERIEKTEIQVDWRGLELLECLKRMTIRCGIPFEVAGELPATLQIEITARAKRITVEQALALLLVPMKLRYVVEADRVVVRAAS